MAEELAPVTPAPIAEAAPEPEIADDASLSDHEAVFGPPDPTLEGDAKKENEDKRASARHRAKSQTASPADVPRIQKFTKDLRERDEKLSAAEKRIQELETRLSPPPAAPASPPAPARIATVGPERGGSGQPLPPTRPKPSMDDISETGKYHTFEAYNEDLVDWKHEQREATWRQQAQEQQQRQQLAAQQQDWQQNEATFGTKLAEFKKTHPDYDTLAATAVGREQLPPAAYKAVHTHENGPSLVYFLFQHPEVLTEMQLLLDGRPPTGEYVALATRWLTSRMAGGSPSPATPVVPLKAAPRPPNPVATGAVKSGEELPGEDSSLADHERAFGRKRR